MESHLRSVTKAITWRVVGLAITASTVWVVTGEPGIAATVGIADTLLKIGSFYMHERAWNRSKFGRVELPNQTYQEDSHRADKLNFRESQGACGQP